MSKQLRTPLKNVRGLGSARGGTHHFTVQRITAIALVPLSFWFVWLLYVPTERTTSMGLSFRMVSSGWRTGTLRPLA